jgi:hypothetical protein
LIISKAFFVVLRAALFAEEKALRLRALDMIFDLPESM